MPLSAPLTWIEISRAAILGNAARFAAQLPEGAALMPVLKAEAYGHGLEIVGRLLVGEGYRWFGVHAADEAFRLAQLAGSEPIKVLVFSAVPAAQAAALARSGGRLTLMDLDQVEELETAGAEAGLRLPVHLKLETGLHRQGFAEGEFEPLARRLAACEHLVPEGVHTHFANIEDTTDHGFARGQMERFARARARLGELGIAPPLVHASCSAAGILFPETHRSLLRLGISLYGHWPSRETRVSAQAAERNQLGLRPALTWKTRLIQIKTVPAGGYVGYGCTWKAEADTRLGVLPVGYFDGYDRRLGNAHVLVRGRRAPVRGRVMMNHVLVDLTHAPEAERGDEVVLLGSQGDETVSAELLAEQIGTINYEVLARLGRHLPRVEVA